MTGTIKTFTEEKGYGFIKGDDKKDYFFHIKSFGKMVQINKVTENAYVSFEQKATPKGYQAINLVFAEVREVAKSTNNTSSTSLEDRYDAPTSVYTSKDANVNSWETIQRSNWIFYGTSRNSPDDAKEMLLKHIEIVGANAAVNLKYFKTTGEEAGTGSGTYYYTIHNFQAIAASIGRKKTNGRYLRSEFEDINTISKEAKRLNRIKTNESSNVKVNSWLIVFAICAIVLFISFNFSQTQTAVANDGISIIVGAGISIFVLLVGLFTIKSVDYDWWLEEIK